MPTSAGTYVLKDWIADQDATIVKQLKEEGAFVLGKANMSEWANYLSFTMPSGYSGKKGQNLNPYGPITFDTSGSSSGSATVVAADFAPLAIEQKRRIDCCTSGAAISSWVTSIFRYGK